MDEHSNPWKQFLADVSGLAKDIREMKERHLPPPRQVSPDRTGPAVRKYAQRENKPEPVPVVVPEDRMMKAAGTVIEVSKEVMDQFPRNSPEDDWELISEKASSRSISGEVIVARAGSVRSLDHENSSHTTLSVPFKIQRTFERTPSSSTLDSQDNILGPSGKGILGVDYVEHIVLPTDTLEGVCLAYKVSASSLRRANHFSGNSMHSAPKKLLIPLSKQALRTGFIRVQDTDTKEYKLSYFQAEYPDINATEARAYLELADWELKDALQSAKEDREWEKEELQGKELKAGQIGVRINFKGGKPLMNLKGIGKSTKEALQKQMKKASTDDESESSKCSEPPAKVKIYSAPPAIASKSVLAEDLFNAAPQHNNFGVEMKPIPKRSSAPGSN